MMSLGSTGSALPRRALGRQLQMFRERAGVSRSGAARAIGVSCQTIGRLEEGQRTKVTDLYVNALADRYGLSDKERTILLDLAVEIRTTIVSGGSWWRAYPNLGLSGFDHFVSLEGTANEVFTWQTALIPGILQTSEYRRALAWAKFPDQPGERIDEMLQVAEQRQDRLLSSDFRLQAVLAEALLSSRVGSDTVMRDQLLHIQHLSELPNVSVRVVPSASSGEIGLLAGGFVVFRFPPLPATRLAQLPVVSVECYAGHLYVEQDPLLSCYIQAAERIRRVASDELASKQKLREAAKEWDR